MKRTIGFFVNKIKALFISVAKATLESQVLINLSVWNQTSEKLIFAKYDNQNSDPIDYHAFQPLHLSTIMHKPVYWPSSQF